MNIENIEYQSPFVLFKIGKHEYRWLPWRTITRNNKTYLATTKQGQLGWHLACGWVNYKQLKSVIK
jgi:hypothetical protein